MSAERLRAAASLLRERAEAATPGPWKWEEPSKDKWPSADESLVQDFVPEGKTYPETVLSGWGYDASGIDASDEDRAYIATMSPPVALALADWLDGAVFRYRFGWELGETPDLDPLALAVADAVLGDQQ